MPRAEGRLRQSDIEIRPLLEAKCRRVMLLRRRVLRSGGRDAIHDLRVATRRLQEALGFFSPVLPPRETERLSRRARKLRRRLGKARNADVLRELAERIAPHLPPEGRRALQSVLPPASRRSARRSSIALPAFYPRAAAVLKHAGHAGTFPFPIQAARLLEERLSDISRAALRARDGSPEALHRLRITVKRHRYLLEILSEAGCAGAERALGEAKKLQECLGNLHDLDLLRERAAGAPEAVQALLNRYRRETLGKARELFHRHPPENWRARLLDAVRRLP